MAQTYGSDVARSRMKAGKCPECGEAPSRHDGWGGPKGCTLTDGGVAERIARYRQDATDDAPRKD